MHDQSHQFRHTNCLHGKWKDMLVMRPDPSIQSDPQSLHQKYLVTEEEYSLDRYPTYCEGSCTLISGYAMEKSYQGTGSKFGSKSYVTLLYKFYHEHLI